WITDTPEGVWVGSITAQSQSLDEIDPSSGQVTRTVVVGPGGSFETSSLSMDFAAGSLWGAYANSSTVVRVDLTLGRVTAVVALPAPNTGAIAANASAVY